MAADRQTIETIARRATTFVAELGVFAAEEYPPETTTLRDILQLVGQYLADVLRSIRDRADYDSETTATQLQHIARSMNELFAMLRYLRASASLSSPPALHAVVSHLVETFFPGTNHLTIVRPQWEYNCKFVNLSYELSKILIGRLSSLTSTEASLLGFKDIRVPDPRLQKRDRLSASQEMMRLLATRARRLVAQHDGTKPEGQSAGAPRVVPDDTHLPRYIGILSLAGIDKADVLLYPMMAHEVAHFIAYSRALPEHLAITSHVTYSHTALRTAAESHGRKVTDAELGGLAKVLTKKIEIGVRELLADVIATRMLGVSYFLGLAEFLKGLFQWSDPPIADSNYPSMRLRLACSLEELSALPDVASVYTAEATDSSMPELRAVLKDWERRLGPRAEPEPIDHRVADIDSAYLHQLATKAVLDSRASIQATARRLAPIAALSVDQSLRARTELLHSKLPPLLEGDNAAAIPLLLTTAWLSQYSDTPSSTADYQRRGRLITKAIELASSPKNDATDDQLKPQAETVGVNGVISGAEILYRASLPLKSASRLRIIPFVRTAVETASLDVHLGHWFKLSRRPKMASIRLERASEFLSSGILHDEFHIPSSKTFILHAGAFALGITREFIGMPHDAMAFVEGKSKLGRTGLIVATATQVAPGFHGCIVLELVNSGTVPLEIRPGIPIAQLVLVGTSQTIASEWLYHGQFDCQIKP